MKPLVWFGTAGLGREFGGVAHVARTTLEALGRNDSPFRVSRVVSLQDPVGKAPPVPLPDGAAWIPCGRSRFRFLKATLRQTVSRPALFLFDHVDLAQCQVLLPAFLRVPHSVWIHGVEVWRQLPARKRAALTSARRLLVNSRFTLQRFQEFHGEAPHARIVPLTYATADGASPVFDAETASTEPWILTVGRMEFGRPKGHQEILAALPHIASVVPNVHWHVVGTGGAFAEFESGVMASPCRDRITLHGFMGEQALQEMFRRSRVFCMPSEGEGFGVVYLEAMRHGCIPVGSLMDAAREVIGDGGRCVNHRDVAALAGEVSALLSLPAEELAAARARARRRSELFQPDTFSQNLVAGMKEALAGGMLS